MKRNNMNSGTRKKSTCQEELAVGVRPRRQEVFLLEEDGRR
jgi:hypothetical protein